MLLWLASFALQGAKGEFQFLGWAALVMLSCALAAHSIDEVKGLPWLTLTTWILGIALSYIYALDRSLGVMRTLQLIVLGWAWILLQKERWNYDAFLSVSRGLAVCTAVYTTYTLVMRHDFAGYLPTNPNFNAAWMTVLSILFLDATFETRSSKENLLWVLHGGLSLWLALLVLYGTSRSSWLGLCAGGAYVLYHRKVPKMVWLLFALASMVLLSQSSFWIKLHLHLFDEDTLTDRLRFWGIAIQMIARYPLTGYGPGNFELGFLQFAFPVMTSAVHYGKITGFAHNGFLQLISEVGLPLGAWVILNAFIIWIVPQGRRPSYPVPIKAALLCLFPAIMFNVVLEMPFIAYTTLFLLRGLQSDQQAPQSEEQSNPQPKMLLQILWVLTSLAILCGSLRAFLIYKDKWGVLLRYTPSDAMAWHMQGFRETLPSQAAFDHRKATQKAPQNPYYWESLGNALESNSTIQDSPEAFLSYRQATLLAPSRATNYLSIARLLFRLGDPRAAIPWIKKARQLEPFYWECDLWLARCYARLGNTRHAAFILRQLRARRLATSTKDPSSPNMSSSYETTILAYDDRVIASELKMLQSHPVHVE